MSNNYSNCGLYFPGTDRVTSFLPGTAQDAGKSKVSVR